ncbi:transposase [Paenibacillus sp. EZ-K15]|uniref:transposase n=1 Tax=Paenibacillus sp. EZ-K15 TaxID=2044275 RepID=UPI001F0000E3|nr:transposase [Paenibacillus sp. EZ-K15]
MSLGLRVWRAGGCPGNHESAGKKKSSRIPKGKRMLKAVLCQCAWSASMTKSSRMRAFFDRIVKRQGKTDCNMKCDT